MYIHTDIYIYIYIERERSNPNLEPWSCTPTIVVQTFLWKYLQLPDTRNGNPASGLMSGSGAAFAKLPVVADNEACKRNLKKPLELEVPSPQCVLQRAH